MDKSEHLGVSVSKSTTQDVDKGHIRSISIRRSQKKGAGRLDIAGCRFLASQILTSMHLLQHSSLDRRVRYYLVISSSQPVPTHAPKEW